MALNSFDLAPNFVNPGYATPEQIANMRAYAKELMSGKGQQTVERPMQGVSNIVASLLGGIEAGRADRLQREAITQTASQTTPLIQQLMGGTHQAGSQQTSATPDYGNTISRIESGGRYDALGPQTRTGDRAYGKYQVMGANIPKWTAQHYGKELTPEEFSRNPDAQEAVFKGQFGNYVNKYGPEGAAKAWFAGEGGMNNPNATDQLGTTVSGYADKFRTAALGPTGGVPPTSPAGATGAGGSPSPAPGLPQVAQNGQTDPRQVAAILANPYVPKETKDMILGLLGPKLTADVYGRPATVSPLAGVRALSVQGQYQPGVMTPVTAGADGSVSTQVPMTPPGQPGGKPNYAGGGVGSAVEPIAQVGRDLANRSKFNQAATVPQVETIAQDQKDAAQAPQIFRVVNTILDDLNTHGDKMSMGPQSAWVNEAKKVIANYAPGAMGKEELSALAASESMEKASSTLGTLLGKQVGGLTGGTDASMFEGLKQVPGSHNSLIGAKALADMIKQGTVLQQKLGEAYRQIPNEIKTGPNFDYIGFKNQFYQAHPIVNPLTGNDIMMDMRSRKKAPAPAPAANDGWDIKR